MQSEPKKEANTLPRSPKKVARSARKKPKNISMFLNVVYHLTQLMLGGIIISALIVPNLTGTTITSQHIFFCILGYFILMTQGILVLSRFGWASKLNYKKRITIHYVMQIVGSIVVIISSALVMANVNENFSTNHGTFGIIAMILTVVTLLIVLPGLLFPKVKYKKIVLVIHAYMGAAIHCFSFMSLVFAFNNYYRAVVGNKNAITAIILTIFSLFGTLLMALYKRIKAACKK